MGITVDLAGSAPETRRSPVSSTWVNGLVLLSGCAALVYEISWTRQLGILFGHTSQAAAVVLASYFGGMAAGYAVGARLSRSVSPLRGYAIAELVLAGWAFAVPPLLHQMSGSSLLSLVDGLPPTVSIAVRILLTLTILSPATIAMGATLPLLARHFSDTAERPAAATSAAYAWNTLGAFTGIASTIGGLLVHLGVEKSSFAAAGASLLCGLGALGLAHRREPIVRSSSKEPAVPPPSAEDRARFRRSLTIAALSGFVTLGLEVLASRLFSLVFHNSTQTFAIVVAVFLFGLSLGAFLASRLMARVSPESLIRYGLWIGGAGISLSVVGFAWGTGMEYVRLGPTFSAYILRSLAHVVAVLLMPAIALGIVLPAAWQGAGSTRLSETVGRLTLANTVAAATGALCASFVLLPWLGLWRSVGLLSCAASAGALLAGNISRRRAAVSLTACLLSLPLWLPLSSALSRSSATQASDFRGLVERWSSAERGEALLRRWETPYGWIDLTQSDATNAYRIRQNLHYSYGSSGEDVVRERRQAHLPLLLHPDPRDVLFLGLGTGITSSGVLPHPEVQTATIVELIPEVVTAAKVLAERDGRDLSDSRLAIEVDDARHYLRGTDRQFDAIVSDLFVPWESTTGYLYTVEHYRAARARLRPGGLFCQWLALYQVGEAELELIADSLASVFPHVTLWWGRLSAGRPIVALVGSEERLAIDIAQAALRFEKLAADRRFGDDELSAPAKLLDLWIGDWPTPSPTALLNTEEHPWVEFSCPASHGSRLTLSGSRLLRYLDRRLLTLPRTALQIDGPVDLQDVHWQRFVLFPTAP
ncbi:fused MFS/spermidine synthase [Planctomyces sp. SH-PL14]|uniref:fused MFS/spermidine synthase n=1 Tax=Planctomyces sp. SH-PL14 TaxID=1632864 RepID=UPI00078DD6C7|nr:fused MFS/spermidine synthase [Planctomyces sp. SH-PL14]AMV20189.1 Spermidine synthase [Planctomyces sp. SH-PL14]